ncbi:hypothetical protein AB0B66_06840 [Catellatospora sp. NPDC049111]|uniref:hypothetical protein n=1 Tax=Catellatospora sp. NPDC049111 TaxID=3155271 RepID=UPI0033C8734C
MVRSVKWRKVLLTLAILVTVAGIAGVMAVVLAYHEVTKIDRSNPKIVLDEYLRAVLVTEDEVGVDLYECDNPEKLSDLKTMRADLDRRESEFKVQMLVSWGAMTSAEKSGTMELGTSLTVTAMENGVVQGRQTEPWYFDLVEDDGWRVCGAKRSLTPTPAASAGS